MQEIKQSSDELYSEPKKLVKLYLALIVLGWSFLLILKVPAPVSTPLDNSMITMAKYGIQSFLANPYVLQIYMLSLLLYTGYVAMETLEYIRLCLGRLYFKLKNN